MSEYSAVEKPKIVQRDGELCQFHVQQSPEVLQELDRSESAAVDGHRGHCQMFVLFQLWLEYCQTSYRHVHATHDTKMYALHRTVP